MDTKNNELISAFVDGESAEAELEIALAALRDSQGKAAWEAYHVAGDVLSSEDMAVSMSADFNARLMARLDKEPTVLAPVSEDGISIRKSARRFLLPGIAAAAAAASFAFVAAPQLMVASKLLPGTGAQNAVVATASVPMSVHAPVV